MRHHNRVFHDQLMRVPLGSVRPSGGGAWTGPSSAAASQPGPVDSAALRPVFRCGEPAGDRRRFAQPQGAALPYWARTAQHSTLADATAKRPADLFTALFAETVGHARRGLRVQDACDLLDATGGQPIYASVTAAKEMPVEAGATYVFGLGYYNYGWWAALDGGSGGWRCPEQVRGHEEGRQPNSS